MWAVKARMKHECCRALQANNRQYCSFSVLCALRHISQIKKSKSTSLKCFLTCLKHYLLSTYENVIILFFNRIFKNVTEKQCSAF